jgi:hypothetical protein
MNIVVQIALFGFIPLVFVLFAILPPRRAVIVAFLIGFLFLPMDPIKVQGISTYSKFTALGVVTLLAAAIFDGGRVLAFRPKWVDVPMLVWCVCPFVSSITNGLGAYDGVSAAVTHMLQWGFPYLVGRIYFSDFEGVRELAIGVFCGGLAYVLPCLFEIKMSPHLHLLVYGHDANWAQEETRRWGGWRPVVFMQHGLMLGAWMAATSLAGTWLYLSGAVRKLLGIPMAWWLLVLVVTTVLCKSTGAIAIFLLGALTLELGRRLKTTIFVWAFVFIAPLYIGFRASGQWSGASLVALARSVAGESRAGSFQYRLQNEDPLAVHALERPVFGWGGWGRNRLTNEEGQDASVTDGLWIIALGQNGLVGLTSLTVALLLPAGLLLRKYGTASWTHPAIAPAGALAMIVTLFMIDCLQNGMLNPIYALAAGTVGVYTIKEPLRCARRTPALHVEREPDWKSNLGKYRLPPRIGET